MSKENSEERAGSSGLTEVFERRKTKPLSP